MLFKSCENNCKGGQNFVAQFKILCVSKPMCAFGHYCNFEVPNFILPNLGKIKVLGQQKVAFGGPHQG